MKIEKPEVTDKLLYYAGSDAAAHQKHLSRKTIRKLTRYADFWQGFHDNRPNAFDRHQTTMLEDPTRPGGWISKHRN